MGRTHREGDEDVEVRFDEPVVVPESRKLVEPLTKALNNAENETTKYWIRTSLQRLVAQNAVEQNRRERNERADDRDGQSNKLDN